MDYFILTYTGKPLGESGESCKTNYSFEDACDVCGTRAKIERELRTKGVNKTDKDFFQTVDGDFIISTKLYEVIIAEDLKVGNLRNVVDSKNNILFYYHFCTELYLPKASETTGLVIEDQCPNCKMNGYFNEAVVGAIEKIFPTKVFPLELVYKNISSTHLNQSDIFNTWEHMGLSNRKAGGKWVVRYARPLLVVSERLKSLLEKNKIGELQFESIKLV